MSPDELRETLILAYRQACELDVLAFKPGNVSVYADGHGMDVENFRHSADASSGPICDASLSLGEKIRQAVRATWTVVDCNTNLGIVLLCAPLIQAMQQRRGSNLRESLALVLRGTTREDAAAAFEAICLAAPGGLGEAPEQDVHAAPQVTLSEAMALAAHRDRVAYQYVTDYRDIFEFALPRYRAALQRWSDEAWAAAYVFSGVLRRIPDSHIERKYGDRFTPWVTERIALLDEWFSRAERPEQCLELVREIDAEFKAAGVNPGTTADLTVASALAARLDTLFDR